MLVASAAQGVHSRRDCGKIAFEIPILPAWAHRMRTCGYRLRSLATVTSSTWAWKKSCCCAASSAKRRTVGASVRLEPFINHDIAVELLLKLRSRLFNCSKGLIPRKRGELAVNPIRDECEERYSLSESGKRFSLDEEVVRFVIDGNCLEASERRLKALREVQGGPLPGKSLVVYEPAYGLVSDVFPCEDGHAMGRAAWKSA